MVNLKNFLDKIKEEVFYYHFKHGRFDLKEMQQVNKSYARTWNEITLKLIVWIAILSTNLMSLMYVNTFLNVSFWQNMIVFGLASWVMKKGFDKFISLSKSLNKKSPLKSSDMRPKQNKK